MLFYATLSRTQSYSTYLFVTVDVLRQCEVGVVRTRVIDLHLPHMSFVLALSLTISLFPSSLCLA